MSQKKFKLPSLSSEQKKDIFKITLVLLAVTVSAALLLAGVNELVSYRFEANDTALTRAAMSRILPADEYVRIDVENDAEGGVKAIYEARSEQSLIGYCVETTAQDYSGELSLVVAVNTDDEVIAVEILSMPENSGTGAKAKNPEFLSQFVGKKGTITAAKEPKDDTQISVISGASVTSRAVTDGVNRAVSAVSQLEAEKAKEADDK